MKGGLLIFHALSPVHVGSGTSLGAVDLPIQRERNSHWPIFPGSSLKGVFRAWAGQQPSVTQETITAAFGPDRAGARGDPDNGKDVQNLAAGAINFGDAYLVALPLRSARGHFAWATCPAVLTRLKRDLELLGLDALTVPSEPAAQQAHFVAKDSKLLLGDKAIVEEFAFTKSSANIDTLADCLDCLVKLAPNADKLKERLIVIQSDMYKHFCRYAMEINARIALDPKTKTVKDGALFYVEDLPAESLLAAPVILQPGRIPKAKAGENQVGDLATMMSKLGGAVVQVGGDETIGRGLCRVHYVPSAAKAGG